MILINVIFTTKNDAVHSCIYYDAFTLIVQMYPNKIQTRHSHLHKLRSITTRNMAEVCLF